jgi:hypothetical protein
MRSVIIVVFVSTMATACVDDLDVSTTTQAVLENNRIVSNRIVSNRIVLNRIVSNRIVSNQISINRYRIVSNELISTAEGRELLSYVVACAIPEEVTLVGTYAGVEYEFPGEIGLAPRWIRHSLRRTDERWVSACLLSRVNRFGISVPISIRGPHSALTVTEAEAEDFSREEGAFYGNIFVPVDEPIIWHSCRGRDEAVSESGSLDLRDCAERDPEHPNLSLCGFEFAGDCADWAPPKNAYACKKFKQPEVDDGCDGDDRQDELRGGYYEQCHDSAGNGHWPGAERFKEVITVFVEP